jgi:hypothetical protein
VALRLDDSFVVGSTTVLDTYDAGYVALPIASTPGGGANVGSLSAVTTVNGVRATAAGNGRMYRLEHSGLPTSGEYTVTAYLQTAAGNRGRFMLFAYQTGSTPSTVGGYAVYHSTGGGLLTLFRYHNGANTTLINTLQNPSGPTNFNVADGAEHSIALHVEVVGGNPVISVTVDGVLADGCPYTDTSGDKKTSGSAAFGIDDGFASDPTVETLNRITFDDPLYSGAGATTQWRNVTTATKAARYEALR